MRHRAEARHGARHPRRAGRAQPLQVGHIGAARDLAHAAVSLMENGYISGTVVHVDGGGHIA